MSLSGDAPEPILIEARRGLLDALGALGPHAADVVLVGAQAIYLHTSEVVTGVALFTKDADVLLIPPVAIAPDIDVAMRGAGFRPGGQPGIWLDDQRQVDLLVPEGLLSSRGSRGARLEGHGDRAARRVPGLEGAAVDNAVRRIESLDENDHRSASMLVAGPAALLVAKLYKLRDRVAEGREGRIEPKDAFDAFRLLRLPTHRLMPGFMKMARSEVSARVSEEAVRALAELFASETSLGTQLAGRYVEGVGDPENVRQSVVALAAELLEALARTHVALGSAPPAGNSP
jgi:hypothetical protein